MKNWKKFASILLALVLCLSLTACGSSKSDAGGSDVEPDVSGPVRSTESEQVGYQPEEPQLGEDDEGRGDVIPDDEGQGDVIPDDGNVAAVLMSGTLPFTNMENLQYENHEDGTYYYEDMAEDGLVIVVNTVLPSNFAADTQTLEDYLTGCAMDLGATNNRLLQSVEQNDAYTQQMTFPVYIVTYTAGENEDTREWTVFAMDTDRYTYLYGFGVTLDAAEEMGSVYQDTFAGLYLYDGE